MINRNKARRAFEPTEDFDWSIDWTRYLRDQGWSWALVLFYSRVPEFHIRLPTIERSRAPGRS